MVDDTFLLPCFPCDENNLPYSKVVLVPFFLWKYSSLEFVTSLTSIITRDDFSWSVLSLAFEGRINECWIGMMNEKVEGKKRRKRSSFRVFPIFGLKFMIIYFVLDLLSLLYLYYAYVIFVGRERNRWENAVGFNELPNQVGAVYFLVDVSWKKKYEGCLPCPRFFTPGQSCSLAESSRVELNQTFYINIR